VSKKRITLVTSSFGVSSRETEGCTYRWKGFVLGHNLVEAAKEMITGPINYYRPGRASELKGLPRGLPTFFLFINLGQHVLLFALNISHVSIYV
jgi:hypothetical protein